MTPEERRKLIEAPLPITTIGTARAHAVGFCPSGWDDEATDTYDYDDFDFNLEDDTWQ